MICMRSSFYIDCLRDILSIVEPIAIILCCCMFAVSYIVLLGISHQAYKLMSNNARIRCCKLWFYNIGVVYQKFNITSAAIPTEELEKLCMSAELLMVNVQRHQLSLVSLATKLIECYPVLQQANNLPLVSKMKYRSLQCRPDPAVFSFLSSCTFTYEYFIINCVNSSFRFGYYFDYVHKKPVLICLPKEESLFDVIVGHLKQNAIAARFDGEEVIALPPSTTLKVLILALCIPYANSSRLTLRDAFDIWRHNATTLPSKSLSKTTLV